MRYILFISLWVFVFLSCSNESAVSPEYTPGWQPPVVKGMVITSARGLNIATWGNPNFPENVDDPNPPPSSQSGPEHLLTMIAPYPNPASGDISIPFGISRYSDVKAWITKARWNTQSGFNNATLGPGQNLIDAHGGKAARILLDGSRELKPGFHTFSLPSYREDPDLRPGFYRIYIEANGVRLWRDIFICQYGMRMPGGLDRFGCR